MKKLLFILSLTVVLLTAIVVEANAEQKPKGNGIQLPTQTSISIEKSPMCFYEVRKLKKG